MIFLINCDELVGLYDLQLLLMVFNMSSYLRVHLHVYARVQCICKMIPSKSVSSSVSFQQSMQCDRRLLCVGFAPMKFSWPGVHNMSGICSSYGSHQPWILHPRWPTNKTDQGLSTFLLSIYPSNFLRRPGQLWPIGIRCMWWSQPWPRLYRGVGSGHRCQRPLVVEKMTWDWVMPWWKANTMIGWGA